MPDVRELDSATAMQAAELFRSCCGASRWVSAMVAHRPFETRDALLSAAVTVWRSLAPGDWHEAFRHHPRIGERVAEIEQTERAQGWSANEQGAIVHANGDLRRLLAAANAEYEQRFGYVYIVNATGKTAAEMLQFARQRLANDPEHELAIAAGEQEQIMLIRVERLLDDDRERRNDR